MTRLRIFTYGLAVLTILLAAAFAFTLTIAVVTQVWWWLLGAVPALILGAIAFAMTWTGAFLLVLEEYDL